MNLEFNNELDINLQDYEQIYVELFKRTIDFLNLKKEYIVSVTFVSKEKIHDINKEFRKIDRPTDVISFAFLDDKSEIIKGNFPIDLGELYICYEVAYENAKIYGNSINRELKFLFIHGLLHLLGYDHMRKEDEEIMFKLQDLILPPIKGE